MNNKAIYASRPWVIYGDNLHADRLKKEIKVLNADFENVKKNAQKENFNARTVACTAYGHDEVRFTTNGKSLFVFVMNPVKGKITIPSLALGAKHKPGKIRSVHLLGGKGKVDFHQDQEKFTLSIPAKLPTKYAAVFEIRGALD